MRIFFVIAVLLLNTGARAQKPDQKGLEQAVASFNKALVNRDTATLNVLLKDNVRYYHSNGWLQSKSDIVNDLYNGKLVYKQVNAEQKGIHFNGNIAQAKMIADVDVLMNGKPLQLKLKVVQVWVYDYGKWQMYSRHSEKI